MGADAYDVYYNQLKGQYKKLSTSYGVFFVRDTSYYESIEPFLGLNSIIRGTNGSFDVIQEWSEKTGRPMFIIYGNSNSKYTNGLIYQLQYYYRSNSILMGHLNGCRIKGKTYNESEYYDYCGFLSFFHKDGEQTEEGLKVEKFIRQFEDEYGKITGEYPIYIVYCKKEDGTIYARYGRFDMSPFMKYSRQFGKEIGYYFDPEGEQTIHTVTFKDYDDSIMLIEHVKDGESATPPTNPTRKGYTFTGWNPSYENITNDTVCVAQYSNDSN